MVQKLTQMIGKNVKLYDMVLQFLRTLFLRTRNVHYCTLRAELLMSLHDLEINEICTVDPCHKVLIMWDVQECYWRIFCCAHSCCPAGLQLGLGLGFRTLNPKVILHSLEPPVNISSWLTSSLLSFHKP